jgi:hypothetical protein
MNHFLLLISAAAYTITSSPSMKDTNMSSTKPIRLAGDIIKKSGFCQRFKGISKAFSLARVIISHGVLEGGGTFKFPNYKKPSRTAALLLGRFAT